MLRRFSFSDYPQALRNMLANIYEKSNFFFLKAIWYVGNAFSVKYFFYEFLHFEYHVVRECQE